MDILKELLKNDPNPNKPKVISINGKPTKAFLKWNRQQMVAGNTTFYADPDYYVSSNGRAVKKIFDKRTTLKTETKKSSARITDGQLLVNTSFDFIGRFTPNNPPSDYNYLFNVLNTTPSLRGTLRMILVTDQTDNVALGYDYGNVVRDVTFEYNGESKKDFNHKYQYMLLALDSDNPNLINYILSLGINCRLYITKSVNISENVVSQTFRENVTTNCLIGPLYQFALINFENATSTASKKKYATSLNKFTDVTYKNGKTKIGLLNKYKNGVPEDCLQDVADALQCDIRIKKPLCKTPFWKVSSGKHTRTSFEFLMTENNHVDVYTSNINKVTFKTQLEMDTLVTELQDSNTYFTFKKAYHQYNTVSTIDTKYTVDCDYFNTLMDWSKDIGLDTIEIDILKYPDVGRFIESAVHHNGTIDFMDRTEFHPNDIHIDMTKAYTQSHTSKYYVGFLGKISDLRPVDNHKQIGYYYVEEVCLKKCNKKFKYLNKRFKWYQSKNIYFKPELDQLEDNGGTCKVTFGCYGSRFDLQFNDDMTTKKKVTATVNGKEISVPYYSIFVGNAYINRHQESLCVHGSELYMSQIIVPESTRVEYDKVGGYGTYYFDKKKCMSTTHLAGGITAYQRIILMEQLLKMDVKRLIRVCVDGIYAEGHDFEMIPSFTEKTKFTLKNGQSDTYLSNMDNYTDDSNICVLYEYVNHLIQTRKPLPFYNTQLILGQGGCGKTYQELMNEHINCLYIPPSNNLSAVVFNEWSDKVIIHTANWHRFTQQPYCVSLCRRVSVVLVDEVSMMTDHLKVGLLQMCKDRGIKVIMMGDVGYQLECMKTTLPDVNGSTPEETAKLKLIWKTIKKDKKDCHPKELLDEWESKGLSTYKPEDFNTSGFENTKTLTTDRRASDCPILIAVKLQLREFIDSDLPLHLSNKIMMGYLNQHIKTITEDELKAIYKPTDFILTPTHEVKDRYTEMFKHLEKYRVTNSTKTYKNGAIMNIKPKGEGVKYNIQHAFTVHSIQGMTIKLEDKLFINPTRLFSIRSLYTAVSRAKNINQINFI